MATVILNHRVKDYTTWKSGFEADAARRDQAGAKLLAVGEQAGDPGNVYIILEVPDVSIMEKMMADPELQQRMKDGGVISKPEAIILQ